MLPVLLLALLVLPFPPQRGRDVRIYVFTAESTSGFSDQLLLDRQEALARLKAELDRKKGIAVTDEGAGADLQVEVLGVSRKDTGRERTTPAVIGLGTNTRNVKDYAVHAAIRVGDYKLEIEGTHRVEKQAVGAVADAVEKWVKQNAAKFGAVAR